MIRRHPLRTFVAVLFLTIAALVVHQLYWAWTAVPGSAVDFIGKTNALIEASEVANRGENGWPHLIKAGELSAAVDAAYTAEHGVNAPVNWPRGVSWPPDASEFYAVEASEDARAAITELLHRKRDAGVHTELEALVASRKFLRHVPPTPRMMDVLLPELAHARKLARLNGLRMRLAAEAGDHAEFVAAYTQTLALSDAVTRQSTLIDHLVGYAISALANNELRLALHERTPPPQTLRELLAALDRYPPRPITLALEGERLFALDVIQWMHTDDGHGSGRFIPATAAALSGGEISTSTGARARNLLWFRYPSKAESIIKVNAFYDDMVARAESTHTRRASMVNDEAQMIADLEKTRFESLKLIIPALNQAFQSNDQYITNHAATRLMLAIELHRAATGAPPASLAALAPAYLPAVPIDAVSGTGFGYFEVRPGADPAGRLYLLYSFGPDGVDNDATPSVASPHTALTRNAPGTDFIWNDTRANQNPPVSPPK